MNRWIALGGLLLILGWVLQREDSPPSPLLLSQSPRATVAHAYPLRHQAVDIPSLEQAVYEQVNQHRLQLGLPPLQMDVRISQEAREHSEAMLNGRMAFSHEGFEQRIAAIAPVIPSHHAAENIGFNQGQMAPVRQAVQSWLESPAHRTNIEGVFNLTGIGVAVSDRGEYFFTQIFIQSSAQSGSVESGDRETRTQE